MCTPPCHPRHFGHQVAGPGSTRLRNRLFLALDSDRAAALSPSSRAGAGARSGRRSWIHRRQRLPEPPEAALEAVSPWCLGKSGWDNAKRLPQQA